MQSLARTRRLARALNIAAVVICIWCFRFPVASSLAAGSLILLPWFAIAAVKDSDGLLRFVKERKGDVYPDLRIAGIFGGLAIWPLAASQYNVIFSSGVWWLTIAAAAAMLAVLLRADSSLRRRWGALAVIVCVSAAWGYGAIVEVNGMFDMTPGVTWITFVQDKQVSAGRSKTYELILLPWGPKDEPNRLTVTRATWDAIQPSDIVYLELRQGALGIRWYRMQRWEHRRRA